MKKTITSIKLNDIKRSSQTREEFAEDISPLSINGLRFTRAENNKEDIEMLESTLLNKRKYKIIKR